MPTGFNIGVAMKNASWFSRSAKAASRFTGRPLCFMLAVAVVLVWVLTGPLFKFSDTWQLVINTGTTIITFLMVFLIQSSQNRDTEAIQIKLDEIIRSTQGAHNALLDLEELEEDDLDEFRNRYAKLALAARECMDGDEADSGTPQVGSDHDA
jgi:low affinity Fe/Cu permease